MEDGFEQPEGIYTTKGTLYGKEGYILLDKDGHLVSKDGKHINEEGFYVRRGVKYGRKIPTHRKKTQFVVYGGGPPVGYPIDAKGHVINARGEHSDAYGVAFYDDSKPITGVAAKRIMSRKRNYKKRRPDVNPFVENRVGTVTTPPGVFPVFLVVGGIIIIIILVGKRK